MASAALSTSATVASSNSHLSQSARGAGERRLLPSSLTLTAQPLQRGALSRRCGPSRATSTVRSSADGGTSTSTVESAGSTSALQAALETRNASAITSILDQLKEAGTAKQWNSYPNATRRPTNVNELTRMGIKNADVLAVGSTRNEAAFLASVVVPTSLLAVAAAAILPGDWAFFTSYLLGSIGLVVLGIGSVAPGLLEAPITMIAPVFGDYKERVLKHEAGHLLVAYLLGVPVSSYSLDIGKEHTNLINEELQRRIIEGKLEAGELDRLAAVAMAGMAAEGLVFDKVMGQQADLISLQRLINRAKPPLKANDQQNITRWGVLYAASLIKSNSKAYEAVVEAMKQEASVEQCIKAIEASA